MEKKIICILVSMLMCATVFTVTGTRNINDANEISASLENIQGVLMAPGDILVDFDMLAQTQQQHLGSEWDGQYYWSTACGSSTSGNAPPYNLYKFDSSGVLTGTYPQPAAITSGWGMRDMAFDGTNLYAGAENGLWSIDPSTGATTLMFSTISPMTCVRALAWVPSEGMFYSGNFGSSFYKFPPSGSPITAVTNPGLTAVYGMAYDDMSDTIWIFDQTGTPQTTLIEYDYHTQTLTGNSFVVPLLTGTTAQLAGGCFYATDCIPGLAVLGGCVQGTPNDRMFVMELAISNLPPDTPGAPSGPDQGVTGTDYTFTATTTDPEGDPIEYWFDWGDGENSGWVSKASATHAWASPGTFDVTVKARDAVHLGESGFSPAHEIEILGGAVLDIKLVKGGIGKIKVTIENIGGVAATGAEWTISLVGGAFIGKESAGIVDVPAGGTAEFSSKFIMGLGKTAITVTATCPDSSDTATRSGTILFFYVYVRPGG